MKKNLALILCLCLLSGFALSEQSDKELQSKYAESVAYPAVQTLCRVGSDDLNKWGTERAVKHSSTAYDIITKFDSGWFSSIRSSVFLNWRSENWVKTSDTTFECDVYCTNRIVFSLEAVGRHDLLDLVDRIGHVGVV